MCKRAGGSCIQCRVENCSVRFHPWCAHHKVLPLYKLLNISMTFVMYSGLFHLLLGGNKRITLLFPE